MAKGVKYPKLPRFAQRHPKPERCHMVHFPKLGLTYIKHPHVPTDAERAEAEAIAHRLFGP